MLCLGPIKDPMSTVVLLVVNTPSRGPASLSWTFLSTGLYLVGLEDARHARR